MRFDWWTFGLQTVNFAVLVWLLHRFLYRPMLRMIDARRAEVDKQFAEARAVEAKATSELRAIEAERVSVAGAREAALWAAAAQAEEAAKARHAQAEAEATALLDRARKMLAAERGEALAEARKAALDLGADVALRLLAEARVKAHEEAWLDRIEQYLTALPKAELDALAAQLHNGETLTVAIASALTPEACDAWRARLRRLFGEDFAVSFDVNPDLVTGAELYFPTAILRFSWRGALAAARSAIEA